MNSRSVELVELSRDSEKLTQPEKAGAGLFTFAGIVAAFGTAACCMLPIYFASLGLSTGWLSSIASVSSPYRNLLFGVSALALLGGAMLLFRQQRKAMTCGPNGVCVRPSQRLLTLAALLFGAGFLWASYNYV